MSSYDSIKVSGSRFFALYMDDLISVTYNELKIATVILPLSLSIKILNYTGINLDIYLVLMPLIQSQTKNRELRTTHSIKSDLLTLSPC